MPEWVNKNEGEPYHKHEWIYSIVQHDGAVLVRRKCYVCDRDQEKPVEIDDDADDLQDAKAKGESS